MCGRYLVDDEVYADMWMLLNSLRADPGADPGAVPGATQGTTQSMAPGAASGVVPCTVSGAVSGVALDMAPGAASGMASDLAPGAASSTASYLAKGEVFPSNIAPVFTKSGAEAVKWGFPHWKNASVIINARAETALEKNMFKKPLLERRCVIPSSGFYEWSRAGSGKKKDKFLLRHPGERVLYMAGMINTFRDATGSTYSAFVILTTAANESVAAIHDRMPVILAPDERDRWLSDDDFMEHALHRPGPELESELST